jgi:hypothetical protein
MCKLLLSFAAALTLAMSLAGCLGTVAATGTRTHAIGTDDNFGGILYKKP